MVPEAQKHAGERPAAKADGLGKGVLPLKIAALQASCHFNYFYEFMT